MKTTGKIALCHIFSLLFSLPIWGQQADTDSVAKRLISHVQSLAYFSEYIPQEKVYLHFDNTSYYQGDDIWFKCYVVTSELHKATPLSKTIYVELLNPGGEMIDKQTLKIENGQCHGNFTLNRLPFYSGYYEVRAYTKYMLNFGDDVIFSRLFPVFDKPQKEGNYEERKMLKYGFGKYPQKRKKPEKGKKVNLKLFPEGGNLVQGITSRVAFEATDEYGNPIDVSGVVINNDKEETARFAVTHGGRGVFDYTPADKKQKAVVEYGNRKHQFDMPETMLQGFVLKTDNLSHPDSIAIELTRSSGTLPQILGLALIGRGKFYNLTFINTEEESVRFKVKKTKLQPGVAWLVLFDSDGKILSDRLIFIHKSGFLNIKASTDKKTYEPYELVNIDFNVIDKEENPILSPFSVSVRDAANEADYRHNILTDLLLMSEIKGYVRNPSYYFEADDDARRTALDQLLMVQGWRRYSWEYMTGAKTFDLKYKPEQGIEVHGQAVSFVRKIPKPGVDISSFLVKKGEDENDQSGSSIEVYKTDSLGRFSFAVDVQGKWDMILSAMEKGKKKDHRIILDRVFSPAPKRYRASDMQVNIADYKNNNVDTEIPDSPQEDVLSLLKGFEDSLAAAGNKTRIHHLSEVTVDAKKGSRENDIYNNRMSSLAYYDVRSEWDNITDNGEYIGKDIHELLININNNFSRRHSPEGEHLIYKNRLPLFVIDYKETKHNEIDYFWYKTVRLEAIKSIYINENLGAMCRYADRRMSPMEVDKIYSCAVFIETFPEGKIPAGAGKGVRKTWLEGYSQVKEFYSPDYSILTPEPDYRRTLYWNPSVVPDKDGKAAIRFYNNSTCRKFNISAETITQDGTIGVYSE